MKKCVHKKKVDAHASSLNYLEYIKTFSGAVAHEFNNVLMGVRGNISLATLKLQDCNGETQFLDQAEMLIDSSKGFTQQLLILSDRSEQVYSHVNVLDLFQKLSTALPSQLQFSISAELKAYCVNADYDQLFMLFSNIIQNATDGYTIVPDNVPIAVTLGIEADSDLVQSQITITITSHRQPVSATELVDIYAPYSRIQLKGQNGLGLTAAYVIAQKHGGELSVTTNGDGLTYRVRIPEHDVEEISEGSKESSAVVPAGTPMKILIMDDDELILTFLSEALTHVGHSVEVAIEGYEAVCKYRSAYELGNPFQLVIMDLTVPGGMGGEEAIKRILKINPDVAAIISSGYSTDLVLANHSAFGFKDVLQKPYSVKELLQVVQTVQDHIS
ncbi:MAG: response regulator [Fibrobacterales bacterium]